MADYPDYEGGKSKLFSASDWAAIEATDKNLNAYDTNIAHGGNASVTYNVPAGSTLYITGISFLIFAFAAADYDHFFYADCDFSAGGTIALRVGGVGGGVVPLNKPIVTEGGDAFIARIINQSNLAACIGVSVWGYEV